jgi:nucleotide-binding universal stress UspA family protein
MSYGTLMVNLDIDQPNKTRLHIAGELAERFEARLIGTAAADIQPPLYFMDGQAAEDILDRERAWVSSRIADCETEFRNVLKALGDRIEWRSALEWPAGFVARNARAGDVVIVGGTTGRTNPARQLNTAEFVVRAGRPVLVVPQGIEWLRLKTIVVGWKDTREARRAINDALPLLHVAREVIVIELIDSEAETGAAKMRVDDVARWLVGHKINASSITTEALIGVTAQLSIMAQDEGADLVVAGAYGHTRLQEWVFGGVTRELLLQQRHCVLLSH